jgi:hypothetical protein
MHPHTRRLPDNQNPRPVLKPDNWSGTMARRGCSEAFCAQNTARYFGFQVVEIDPHARPNIPAICRMQIQY